MIGMKKIVRRDWASHARLVLSVPLAQTIRVEARSRFARPLEAPNGKAVVSYYHLGDQWAF